MNVNFQEIEPQQVADHVQPGSSSRRAIDRLGFRVVLVLAVVLLPLMIVSTLRSQVVAEAKISSAQFDLLGQTIRVGQQESLRLARVDALAKGLSHSVLLLFADREICTRYIIDSLRATPAEFAGYYDVSGEAVCTSEDAPFSLDVTTIYQDPQQIRWPAVHVTPPITSEARPALMLTYPVYASSGDLTGFTVVSTQLMPVGVRENPQTDTQFLTLDRAGDVISSAASAENAQQTLPEVGFDPRAATSPTSFRAVGRDGVSRFYGLTSVLGEELFVLASRPAPSQSAGLLSAKNRSWFFPALMWLASLAVAWFATSMFFTGQVLRLRQSMWQFAEARQVVQPRLFRAASSELRDVADSFIGMTDKILRDEAQIEEALRQKDVLLREVHHRVKNNLQLIASIMSMQMRQTGSHEVKNILKTLHDRVNSLATVHRSLYQTTGRVDIAMDEHLDTIMHQVMRMGVDIDLGIDVRTSFDRIVLNPDQAVPLSLFVTEAMTNALKYIGAKDGSDKWISLDLKRVDSGMAEVVIENSLPDEITEPDPLSSSGLGSELMEAFAEQLGGTLTTNPAKDRYRVAVRFPIEPLTMQ